MGCAPFLALLLVVVVVVVAAAAALPLVANGCVEEERVALLDFKRGIIDQYDNLHSWNSSNQDCCSWVGIYCSTYNDESSSSSGGGGHVIGLDLSDIPMSGKISPSLLVLKHLEDLGLGYGDFILPPFIGSFSNLTSLSLSQFRGPIPPELGKLQNLERLSLSRDDFQGIPIPPFIGSFSNLTSLTLSGFEGPIPPELRMFRNLEDLYLGGNDFHGIPIPPFIGSFSNLTSLDLSYNGFEGPIPPELGKLQILLYLSILEEKTTSKRLYADNLDWMSNLSSLHRLELQDLNITSFDWLHAIKHLESLTLGVDGVHGIPIPPLIGSIQNLTFLTLDGFEGQIPFELGMLRNLQDLTISNDNKGYPMYVENSRWISNLSSLQTLELSNVDLGRVLDWELSLSKLPSLQSYKLESCNITSRTCDINHGFASLTSLQLTGTNFGRSIPIWAFSLNHLTSLTLKDCSLDSVLSERHFANLTSLAELDLSKNPLLHIHITPNWVPPFNLTRLTLSSCRVGPAFPLWIRTQKTLESLFLSDALLEDSIPTWIWGFSTSLVVSKLSQNKLYGGIPDNMQLLLGGRYVDLSSNNLSGQLPKNINPNLVKMNLSNNSFSGSLSRLLCHRVRTPYAMQALDLSNNLLSGNMSNCWDGWRNLTHLRLGNNRLSGNIPLHIISNCTKLVTLDLSINKLGGSLKSRYWGKLLNLRVLMLDSNKFSGIIPYGACSLNSLQVLNLSNNYLFGPIPTCFRNFTGMIMKQKFGGFNVKFSFYTSNVRMSLSLKGRVDEYEDILGFVTLLDLSNNHLSGEIPKELMDLKELHYLNLSKNQLTGEIPMAIKSMGALESLDVSRNKLSGEIPRTISHLTFLNHLNVSYNRLTGEIPSGPQLDTSDPSAFIGNALCGRPLPETCGTSDASNSKHVENSKGEEEEEEDSLLPFYVSFPVGFGAGASAVFITLLFRHSWRIKFFHCADTMLNINS